MRRAVHGELKGKRRKTFHFFSGVAGPLGDKLDHGWGQVGISIHGHLLEGPGASDDDENNGQENEEALTKSELDNAMNHEGRGTTVEISDALGIEEGFFTALGGPATAGEPSTDTLRSE
jgi:hypothetical protein